MTIKMSTKRNKDVGTRIYRSRAGDITITSDSVLPKERGRWGVEERGDMRSGNYYGDVKK